MIAASAVTFGAQPARADVDIYTTPGTHTVNGRQWKTACAKYSSTVERCRTEILATQVTIQGGRYVSTTGWAFNNLTYKASPRANWIDNNLGKNAAWTSADGRDWYTECDTPSSGRNGCRSYIWGSAISAQKTATGTRYVQTEGWMFNNQVRFSDDVYAVYKGTGDKVIKLPKGATELYIDATHLGKSNFTVFGLDARNYETELVADEIGKVRTRGAVGLESDDTVALAVEADGAWTLIVKPLSAAPTLTSQGLAGKGNDVVWYYITVPRGFRVTHSGSSDFIVHQSALDESRTIVDATGNVGTVGQFLAGPSIIEIIADGTWSIR